MKRITIFLALFLVFNISYGQESPTSVRISGIVIEADSLTPVPFTSIMIKNSPRGTVSDNSGYFTIFAYEFDTLVFTNVGYSASTFVVPPNLPEENYGLVHVMYSDTLILDELVVMPWPAPENLASTFLSLEVKKNLSTRSTEAQRNLQSSLDQQLAREKYFYDQMRYNRLYNLTGFIPPNNFLNPINWANFIRDWREGRFNTDLEDIPDMNRD